MRVKTLIVDDEPLARQRIRNLLEEDPEIHIVGEGRNGTEANRLITSLAPDLLFLDIQMPDYDGFNVLLGVKLGHCPVTVFVTAFDQFAIQAFESNALDYLLKPYDDQRFFKSLATAKQQVKLQQFARLNEDLKNLIASYEWEQLTDPISIPIKKNGMILQVGIKDIHWIEAQGNYVKLQLQNDWYLYRCTLSHLEKKLQQHNFLRIHRGLLVNIDFIDRISYQHNNEYRFVFRNGKAKNSSRSYKNSISTYLTACATRT